MLKVSVELWHDSGLQLIKIVGARLIRLGGLGFRQMDWLYTTSLSKQHHHVQHVHLRCF